ncbi:MAG TPA: YraN family protein [Spirochaetia bacterium]|nr:YraN family protein [Spirochaetia bacterium]
MRRSPRSAGLGAAGEDQAALHLAAEGWTILARNYRSRYGEIDIVASREDEVAFVEVKAWRALSQGDLEYAVDYRKQGRVALTARRFLADNRRLADRRMRFDVVFLGGDGAGVRHIEHAFDGGSD